jgi:F420-dependent methylenetetrahydromethanopterin dehydrogenase
VSASGPHDRPTAAELVEAVREFLDRDVMAATDGRVQFHTRVAVNVLGMVQRELEQGPAHAAAHDERLHALGFANEADLAAAIRRGDLDDRYAEVKAVVAATVADKLSVANPRYPRQ